MDHIPCRQRVFPLQMAPEFIRCYSDYVFWLKELLERLGREAALKVWNQAFSDTDDELLTAILASGWEAVEDESTAVEEQMAKALAESFALPVEKVSLEKARRIIENSSPISQIRQRFRNLDVVRQATVYEWLHMFRGGLSSLVESLIALHEKEGELIAHTVMLRKSAAGPQGAMKAEEALKLFAIRHDKDTKQAAGLEYEHVRVSESEVVIHIKECEWARYYHERHPRVGYLLVCSMDEPDYRALSPRIRMQRTQTLMEGGRLCDFRIYAVADR